jgi:cation:H+ antiporter
VIGVFLFRRPLTAFCDLKSFRLLILMIILMTGLVLGVALFDPADGWRAPGQIGLASWVLLILYLAGSWRIFRNEHPASPQCLPAFPTRERKIISRYFYPRLALSIILVVTGGFWMAWAGREIAALTGWGDGFIGALFLALVTSLPEVSVCLGAVRICAPEMALGNILGSNIFNLGIIFWADLAYRPGSILAGASDPVLLSAGLGIVLVILVALSLKPKRSAAGREVFMLNTIIILVYLIGMRWIFRLSTGGVG